MFQPLPPIALNSARLLRARGLSRTTAIKLESALLEKRGVELHSNRFGFKLGLKLIARFIFKEEDFELD